MRDLRFGANSALIRADSVTWPDGCTESLWQNRFSEQKLHADGNTSG